MKVILAGCPKTGTKSLVEVFKRLGYTVYDYEEHYWFLSRQWMKIFRDGGTTQDFRDMYKGVDVVSDIPACFFWEQISQAFPEAKIILMVRDNEDVWWESVYNQVKKLRMSLFTLITLLSPTAIHHFYYSNQMLRIIFGSPSVWPWKAYVANPLVSKMFYKRQNCHVLQAAPNKSFLCTMLKMAGIHCAIFLELVCQIFLSHIETSRVNWLRRQLQQALYS